MSPTATVYTKTCVLGSPLAISADGTIIAASQAGCYGGLGVSGTSIALFVKPASGWQPMPAPTVTVGDVNGSSRCGYNFAMSSDGKTIVCTDTLGYARKSFLYIFDEPAGGWSASTGLPSSSIRLSYIPGMVAINARTIAVANSANGTVNVYQRTSSGIQQLATLSASDGAGLCCTVVLDGQTVAVNGYMSDDNTGKVYLFSKPSTGWSNATETAQFTAPNVSSYVFFGAAIAKSGKALLIGGLYTSAAYVYLQPATGWQSTGNPNITLLSTDPYQQAFGDAVAMQGSTIIIGDALEGAQSNQNGAAYMYQAQ